MMDCDTKFMEVDKKRDDDEVSDFSICTLVRWFLFLVLQRLFIALVGRMVLATIGVTTKYVLMYFIVLSLTISPNTRASSESDE